MNEEIGEVSSGENQKAAFLRLEECVASKTQSLVTAFPNQPS